MLGLFFCCKIMLIRFSIFKMADLSGMEKKHTRNFSLDVHPYMLTIRKPKVEATTTEPLPSEHNMDTVYLEGTHTIVHVSGAITGIPNVSVALTLCPLMQWFSTFLNRDPQFNKHCCTPVDTHTHMPV